MTRDLAALPLRLLIDEGLAYYICPDSDALHVAPVCIDDSIDWDAEALVALDRIDEKDADRCREIEVMLRA